MRQQHAAFAGRAEVLGHVERERARVAQRAAGLPVAARAVRLCAVLEQQQPVLVDQRRGNLGRRIKRPILP